VASLVVRGIEFVDPQHCRRGLLPHARRAMIGKFDAGGFERTLERLGGRARHGLFALEFAYDGNFDARGGCKAIFGPVEEAASSG
jgi:hypothetical protein